MATIRPSIWATAAPAAGSASSFARSPAEFACCAANWSRSRPETRGEKTMKPQLTKGNEAIVKAAVLAGCRAYYGYPITPASEIAEAASLYLRRARGVFGQAESAVAAINMLYGGAAAGVRCMTASSGPGIILMQEGISCLAGAELPCVIADIMRGGPGLGNIAPEQGDYNQIVKGGGHQPDAGRYQLPGRRGVALRDCRHYARRARPGQHRARAGRLQPDREGRGARQLPHPGGGAGFGTGDGGPDHVGLRSG